MNERIKKFERQSGIELYGLGLDRVKWEYALTKYTELIVRECANVADRYVVDGDIDIAEIIKRDFGIDEHKGWVCSKCGVDRTKDVCPKGHWAAATGDCPMTAEAQ
jgi:hypothetical protein